jgi:hypothetical protein
LKKNADKAAFMDIMKYENIITIIQHSWHMSVSELKSLKISLYIHNLLYSHVTAY